MWCLPVIMLAVCLGQWWLWPLAALLWWLTAWSNGARQALAYLLLALVLTLYCQAQLQRALAARLPLALAGEELLFQLQVQDLPLHTTLTANNGSASGKRAERVSFAALGDSSDPRWPGKHQLLLTWYSDDTSAVQPGARLQAQVRLRPVHGLVNEVGFDAERHALARGVAAHGSVLSVSAEQQSHGSNRGIDHWRAELASRLRQRLHGYPHAEALLPALVAGDRRSLQSHHWQILQSTGTAHLVAISGLHISLVAGLVWWLGRWLISGLLAGTIGVRTAQRLAALPALTAALGYAALAGFSLPTQRALLMTALAMWILVSSRPRSAWHNLLLVALLVTVPAPLAWLDSSFWLSFGAVTLLVFAHSAGQGGLIRLQLILTLVFGLLAGQLFGWWSLSALPANLVLVPLYSLLLVPLALLGALFDSTLLLELAAQLVNYSWQWLLWLAPWPSLPLPTSLLTTLLLALLLLRWLLPALPGPRWLLLACLLPWLWPQHQRPLPGDVELLVFDAGQGLMTALRTRNHLVLFDLGPGWQDGDVASRVLVPWLRKQRLQPDLIFVSHRHLDHAGGAGLFSGVAYRGRVFAGEPEALPGSHACLRGQRWHFDEVALEVLWPPAEMALQHSNNRSCVVKVVGNNQSILLTGDIGRQVEHWLVQQDDLRADVLQVPHHGSRSSSSFALLRAVAPTYAFVGAGYRNSFGHPDSSIMARYQQAQIDVAVTANSGMLVYGRRDRAAKGLGPLRWRQHAPFPWRLSEPVVE